MSLTSSSRREFVRIIQFIDVPKKFFKLLLRIFLVFFKLLSAVRDLQLWTRIIVQTLLLRHYLNLVLVEIWQVVVIHVMDGLN